MKKVLFLVGTFLFSVGLMAGRPSVSIGTGHLLLPDRGNYAYSLESAEWAASLDFQYQFSPHFATGITYTRDTIRFQEWAIRHRFSNHPSPIGHTYNFVDAYAAFPLGTGDKVQLSPIAGLGLVSTPDATNMSEFVGIDTTYYFTHHLFATMRFKIKHTVYMERDATFGESALLIGWRF